MEMKWRYGVEPLESEMVGEAKKKAVKVTDWGVGVDWLEIQERKQQNCYY